MIGAGVLLFRKLSTLSLMVAQSTEIYVDTNDKSESTVGIELLTSPDRPSARPHSNSRTITPDKRAVTTSQPNRLLNRLDSLSKALKQSLVGTNSIGSLIV